MISTSTYSDFWNYVHEHRLDGAFFYFVNLSDDYFWCNGHRAETIGSDTYRPIGLEVSPVNQNANLFNGNYSIGQVKITLQNNERGALSGDVRLSEIFSSTKEYISKPVTIYLGVYDGDSFYYLPYYVGRVSDIQYSLTSITFTAIDTALIDLPELPNTEFSRTSYPYIAQELEGVPIPICYGRWDYEQGHSNGYGYLTCVPAVVVENNVDGTNQNIRLKLSDAQLDAWRETLIYDQGRNSLGKILDTISYTIADSEAEISLFTHDSKSFMSAEFHLYPDRVSALTENVNNPSNAFNNSYSDYAVLDDQGGLSNGKIGLLFPQVEPFSPDELFPEISDTTGETTSALSDCVIEISGYAGSTFQTGSVLSINFENGGIHEILTASTVNALSDSNSFNYTTTAKLKLCNPRVFNGTDAILQLQENGSSAVDIIPNEGIYQTMGQLASEIESQIQGSGSFANTYTVRYLKDANTIKVFRESGSVTFQLVNSTYSTDVGLTAATGYATENVTGTTILDVPDGDFSYCIPTITAITTTPYADFHLKGVRIKYNYRYRQYQTAQPIATGRLPISRNTIPNDRGSRSRNRTYGQGGADYPDIVSVLSRDSAIDKVSGASYFALVDGVPTGSTYFKNGPEIIQNIIEDRIGLDEFVDAGKFSSAALDTQITNLSFYLSNSTPAKSVLTAIARYSLGFMFLTPEGMFGIKCVKSSYSPSDVDFTIYFRDLIQPIGAAASLRRSNVFDVSTDLDFEYMYNWAKGEYSKSINRTVNTSSDKQVDVQPKTFECVYCTDDGEAQTIAEWYSGDGTLNTFGQFGKPRTIIEITFLDPRFHFAELGDICAFDSSDWDTRITAFEDTISNLFFMVIGKQSDSRSIRLTLLEVYKALPS